MSEASRVVLHLQEKHLEAAALANCGSGAFVVLAEELSLSDQSKKPMFSLA